MKLGDDLERVRRLSDQQLLTGLKGALCAQRRSVAEVVAHLGEVEERRLHLSGGYSSMFDYCSSHLHMSEDEAYRRIEVARLARRFPQLFQKLARGELSLSVAALLRSHLPAAPRRRATRSDRHGAGAASAHAAAEHTRYIPSHVRRAVFERDDARCAWHAADGTRCNSRAWLEHDHAIPWAKGGPSDAKHIRLFCRAHNRLAAEQTDGRDIIDRIIARRQAPHPHSAQLATRGPGSGEDPPAQREASNGREQNRAREPPKL